MPKDMLRLITPNVGGGFGMKAFVYPEHALVVWASRKLKRPVKWQEDRSEAFISDNQGRDHRARAELALDENGRFLGLRVSILANLAYLSPLALSFRLARPILSLGSMRSGPSTSMLKAYVPIPCRSAPIVVPVAPRPHWSMRPHATSA